MRLGVTRPLKFLNHFTIIGIGKIPGTLESTSTTS